MPNAFMVAKEKARKSGADSFDYTNGDGVKKTYHKKKTATGMVIYSSQKGGDKTAEPAKTAKTTAKATDSVKTATSDDLASGAVCPLVNVGGILDTRDGSGSVAQADKVACNIAPAAKGGGRRRRRGGRKSRRGGKSRKRRGGRKSRKGGRKSRRGGKSRKRRAGRKSRKGGRRKRR